MTAAPDRLAAALAGRYRVERELGAGGMATVYLATDVRHQRKVALKVLHPELSAVLGPERFLKEIELTANLQHPHILPLFDSGSADGQLYYVMPFVEGESLRGRLERERQLPIADALRIATEVAGALQYAHERAVIHRDIKPENILLQGAHAVVADFGIALAVQQAGGQRMTQTGLSLGTPQYMAPEQAMGEKTIDARADIYALGAVTYEMLTGEAPFTGANAQAIVARVLTTPPAPITQTRPTVSARVEHAVLTALAKLPADRFGTARDFAAALVTPAGGEPAGDDHRSADGATARAAARATPMRVRPLTLVAAALALVATAAVSFVAGRARTGSSDAPIREFGRAIQATWEPGLEVMPAISPDGKQIAYAAGTPTRMRLFVRPVAGGRATPITDDTSAVETHPHWSRDGSRLLFISSGRVVSAPSGGGTVRQEVPSRGGQVLSVAWSPDERRIAFSSADTVFVRESDGVVRRLAQVSGAAACVWGAQDLVACTSGNPWYLTPGILFNNQSSTTIVVIRVRDGTVRLVSDSTSGNHMPQWSVDGRWLYYLSDRNGARDLYAQRMTDDGTATGALARLTTGLDAHSFTLTSDGRRVAYSLLTETANVWSLPVDGAARARAEQVTSGQQTIGNIVVSHDGAWLYYDSDLAGDGDLYRTRLPSGAPERLTSELGSEFAPAPSPDGREVAFHAIRGGSRNVYTLPLDGGSLQTVVATPREEGLVRWSPDGRTIAFSDLHVGGNAFLATRTADGKWSPPRRLTPGVFVKWSPDGRQLAFVDQIFGGSVFVTDVDGSAPRKIFDGSRPNGPRALANAWSDDGQAIYIKASNAAGNSEVWTVPSQGGEPRLLTTLGDVRRRSDQFDFDVARGRLYFTLKDVESDLWVIDVVR